MVKWCSRGQHEVDVSLFNKRSKSKDGLTVWCKPCLADYERERYHNGDRVRKIRNRNTQVERTRQKYWDFLCSSVCDNCGNSDPEVLECDHREPSEKSFNVSEMIWYYSWSRIKSEIDKCDILCANCHRKRTIRQFGLWRGVASSS